MKLDLKRMFPIVDPPSAWLMGIKAQCLFEVGIITAAQKQTIDRRAKEIVSIPAPAELRGKNGWHVGAIRT
jgi:hypothetical protein